MRKALLVLIAMTFAAVPALAFHDAGVAHCNGCHTMHNSQDGVLVDSDSANGNEWLLNDSTPSDVCLNCHADHLGAVFGDDPLAPPRLIGAGNFAFLLEDNLNDSHGGSELAHDENGNGVFDPGWDTWANAIPGDAAGHNINAPGHGLSADGTLSTAPGGSFPAAVLGCTSCHDPHGNENFRMLYGARSVQDGVATFENDAPTAEGLSIFYGAPEGNLNHTAYQAGMSAWCGNCHPNFHQNNTQFAHPSGSPLTGGTQTTYNLYNGTASQTGANPDNAYLAATPIQDPAAAVDSRAGATGNSTVMCLTCHRAHASSAPDAGRWDFGVTLLSDDGGESGSYAIPNPYVNVGQRSLCNKCHNKDEDDHIQ